MALRWPNMAFWRQLGPNLSPSWLQVASRWAQVGSKLAQVGPKLSPRSALGGSKRVSWRVPSGSEEGSGGSLRPKGPQSRSRYPFLIDFWSIFDDFWIYFGTFLDRFFRYVLGSNLVRVEG